MDILGHDYCAHHSQRSLQGSPTLNSLFLPVSLNIPEKAVDLGLGLVGWGCDREGAPSLELDRQQNQARWGPGLSKVKGKGNRGALTEARLLHSSYPLGPRWISLTYASGPATDFPLELEGLGLSQAL